jgi:hypothetical protein
MNQWITRIALLTTLFAAGDVCRAGSDTERDVRQTVRARQVLLQDPALAPHNVGVVVRDRIATLWGPIPSAPLRQRAEQALRGLFELAEVRNHLEVSGAEPELASTGPPFLPARLPPAPPRLAPRPVDPPRPAPPAPTANTPSNEVELPPIDLRIRETKPARMPVGP